MKKLPYVVQILDIIDHLDKYTDTELHSLMYKFARRKVDYLQFFLVNVWGKQHEFSQPIRKRDSDEKFYFFENDEVVFNELFFTQLKRLANICYEWGVGLFIIFDDHCGTKKTLRPKNPWYNNVDQISGVYDTSPQATRVWKAMQKKVIDTVGLRVKRKGVLGLPMLGRKNWFSIGSEVYCADNHQAIHEFGREWALPRALNLRKLGYKGKIHFSAHPQAGHAIQAYCSPEGRDWGSTFKWADTVWQYHGWIYPDDCTDIISNTTRGRRIAYSDDGVQTKEAKDMAICINGDRYCSAKVHLVTRLIEHVIDLCDVRGKFGRKRVLDHIAQLPRSISEMYQNFNNVHQGRDLGVWTTTSKKIFNVYPFKEYGKWRLRKNGLEGG